MCPDKYKIIALYNDEGKRYYQIGKKKDDGQPLCTDNVEWWPDKSGKPMKLPDDWNLAMKTLKKCKRTSDE